MSVEILDVGDHVECDFCSADYTGKPDTGGLLFQSKAVCPKCAQRVEVNAMVHGEERFIRARCPAGVTFQAFVLGIRAGNNKVTVYTGDEALEMLNRRQKGN